MKWRSPVCVLRPGRRWRVHLTQPALAFSAEEDWMAMDEQVDPVSADFLAIGREAACRYGFSRDAEMKRYQLTENWMFRVQDASGHPPAVLRIYRPGVNSRDEIRSELAWMSALREE